MPEILAVPQGVNQSTKSNRSSSYLKSNGICKSIEIWKSSTCARLVNNAENPCGVALPHTITAPRSVLHTCKVYKFSLFWVIPHYLEKAIIGDCYSIASSVPSDDLDSAAAAAGPSAGSPMIVRMPFAKSPSATFSNRVTSFAASNLRARQQ